MAKEILAKREVKKLIAGYKIKLEKLNIPVAAMYVYGSYAKGKPNKWSDIDLCVVSPTFTDRIDSTMTLMKIRGENELLLSPIAFSPSSFTDENPLAWEIKHTGISVN